MTTIRIGERVEIAFKSEKLDKGYVYLVYGMSGERKGLYKIGKSVNPQSRFGSLRREYSTEVSCACLVWSDYHSALEARLHGKYTTCRVDGEWFNLDQDAVVYIKSLSNVDMDNVLADCNNYVSNCYAQVLAG